MKAFNGLRWVLVLVLVGLCSCATEKDDVSVYDNLKDVHHLTLAEMSLNKMGAIDDMTWDKAEGISEHIGAFVNNFKAGKRIGVYSYNTYLQAYIDLDELIGEDVKVDNKRKFVNLTLPAVRIAYLGRDMGIKEEHLRVTGLRSSITPQERAEVKEAMNEALKKDVENSPELRRKIVSEAETKAREYFSILLKNLGYDCHIDFRK
ncbi:MAG: DUF4230 domain-containing protein [Duncaniella sp.]|nr:DUF4230 domain-containing protein [Muribaculum sp.]MCM1254631.1 DUF4230 domain-containing protein [Duncaniella sp.]